MTCYWRRWCPDGCGKKAYCVKVGKDRGMYKCSVCEKLFTKEQIEEA